MAKKQKSSVTILGWKQVGKTLIVSYLLDNETLTVSKTIADKELRDQVKELVKSTIATPKKQDLHTQVIDLFVKKDDVVGEVAEEITVSEGKKKHTEEYKNKSFAVQYLTEQKPFDLSSLDNESLEFTKTAFFENNFEIVSVKNQKVCVIKNTNISVPVELFPKFNKVSSKQGLLEFLRKVALNPDPIAAKGLLKYATMENLFSIMENGFMIGYKMVRSKTERSEEDIVITNLAKEGADLNTLKLNYVGGKIEVVAAEPNELTIMKKLVLDKENKLNQFVDSHSRSMNISLFVPAVIERKHCDTNPGNTCSRGLHVGTYNYASNFSGDTLLMVAFSPEDAVAVPQDGGKIRVCRYYPIKVLRSQVTFDSLPETEKIALIASVNTLDSRFEKEKIEQQNPELAKLTYSELAKKLEELEEEGEQEQFTVVRNVILRFYTNVGSSPQMMSIPESIEQKKEEAMKTVAKKASSRKITVKKEDVVVEEAKDAISEVSEPSASKKKTTKKKDTVVESEEKSSGLLISKEEEAIIQKKIASVKKMRHKLINYIVYRVTNREFDENHKSFNSVTIQFSRSDSPITENNAVKLMNLDEFDKLLNPSDAK